MIASTSFKGNRLLDGLAPLSRKRILALCEPVDLTFGDVLCEPKRAYTHAFFPLTGFISLVQSVGTHPPLEMGLIGNEGMLGATMALGVAAAPLRGVVQGSGTAWRIPVVALRNEIDRRPELLRSLNRYLYVLTAQLSQTAACTRFHDIEARLSRWLLMTHDRAHGDHFHLTHKFLADMLGVQRSAVTIAAGQLQAGGFIHYTRGEIRILDRGGLESRSCECYEAVIRDYALLFPPLGAADQRTSPPRMK